MGCVRTILRQRRLRRLAFVLGEGDLRHIIILRHMYRRHKRLIYPDLKAIQLELNTKINDVYHSLNSTDLVRKPGICPLLSHVQRELQV